MVDKELININRKIEDANYRYKMPKMTTVVQGSGGGMKTRLTNLVDVARALKVKTDYPLTFIGIELGTQIEYRESEGACLINGKNETNVIQDKLFKFIEKYVLCPFCKLPEIIIQIKNKEVRSKCKACGKKCKLDNSHKFAKHIIKNPPSNEEDSKNIEEGGSSQVKDKEGSSSQSKSLDKSIKEKIRELMKSTSEIIQSMKETVVDDLLKVYADLEPDKKYYVLIHSLYDCNIFKYFKKRSFILKQIVEKDSKKEEAPYHILITIIDLTIKRYAKEYYNVITKHIPSILYVLYDEDFITEDWYFRFLKGNIKANNIFYERESFDQFANFAEEFTRWLETAPNEIEQIVVNEVKTETKKKIDIDNI